MSGNLLAVAEQLRQMIATEKRFLRENQENLRPENLQHAKGFVVGLGLALDYIERATDQPPAPPLICPSCGRNLREHGVLRAHAVWHWHSYAFPDSDPSVALWQYSSPSNDIQVDGGRLGTRYQCGYPLCNAPITDPAVVEQLDAIRYATTVWEEEDDEP